MNAYSNADAVAPYRAYGGRVRLLLASGGVQLPLAYQAPRQGVAPLPTARLLQVAQPTAAVVIEWAGTRVLMKPEPPKLLTLGSFILAQAAAQCEGPGRDALGQDVLAASGYFVLYTGDRPENLVLPAVWFPWDGRYGTDPTQVPQYLYTPADLGFAEYLPGAGVQTNKINNPPPASAGAGSKLYL